MKTITLHFSDKVLQELKAEARIKKAMGIKYVLTDVVCIKIFGAIERGDTEHTMSYEKEGQNEI